MGAGELLFATFMVGDPESPFSKYTFNVFMGSFEWLDISSEYVIVLRTFTPTRVLGSSFSWGIQVRVLGLWIELMGIATRSPCSAIGVLTSYSVFTLISFLLPWLCDVLMVSIEIVLASPSTCLLSSSAFPVEELLEATTIPRPTKSPVTLQLLKLGLMYLASSDCCATTSLALTGCSVVAGTKRRISW